MRFTGRVSVALLVVLLLSISVAAAQDTAVQEFIGGVSPETEYAFFDLYGMQAGDTLYVYAESDEFDTMILVGNIDFSEELARNDDIDASNFNSAVQYTFPADGDYSVAITDCCRSDVSGSFRVVLGLNASGVLYDDAAPTGAAFADYINPIEATPIPAMTGREQIQSFNGVVSAESRVAYFDLFDMVGGQTLYIYAGSTEIDPYLAVCDIECQEIMAEDDDSGGQYNAALAFTFPADGDYSIAVYDCCDESAAGSFNLLVGYDAPILLSGGGSDTGAQIAVPYNPAPETVSPGDFGPNDRQVQEFTGAVSPEQEFNFYDLFGLRAGETVYIYAESNEFDTMIVVGDIDFNEELARNDDIAEGSNVNSALAFVVPADGDYSIAITDCCRSDVSGGFRMVIGLNAPDVLEGTARSNGAEIALVYRGENATVGDYDRTPPATCDQQQAQERPVLSGPEFTRETQNFIIHYTDSGRDGVTEDYVSAVQTTMEQVLQIETQQMGWPLPPSDCGEGGDTRFDVYLMETLSDGIMGYAQPGGMVGDNPNSTYVETWAAYSFLVLDNDFNGHPTPRPAMRVTAAHEFHHGVQFGYDLNDAVNWVYEATATWMETQTFMNDEDATPYVADLFEYPDLCIGSTPDDPDYSTRIYAEWLLIDNIARDYGVESIKRMWEDFADYEGMEAFYTFLSRIGTTPQDVAMRFAIRNLLLDYDLAAKFRGRVRLEGKINGPGVVAPRSTGVEELGADYLQVSTPGTYTFAIDRPNLRLVVVGIDQTSGTAQVFDLGQSGSVDTTPYSQTYVIILNTSQHADPESCTMTNWSLNVLSGKGAPLATPLPEVFNASRFVPGG
ncbi:MAG: hypothetical protein H6671_12855 [Anaerolineaceae bacterium]|nr:hypothetical protein [Anaerolineaceae bacterium]